ncbi:hypothetical protein NHF46_12865 [Arthrobacter alpinus]|nr:hypothetical protein [Arthrobacter alpinus]
MSAATDTTPSTTDGDVAADLFSRDIEVDGAGPAAKAEPENSSSLGREWLLLLIATLARTGLILAVSMAAWASVPALWGWGANNRDEWFHGTKHQHRRRGGGSSPGSH